MSLVPTRFRRFAGARPTAPDNSTFPAAIQGEDYGRYAAAVRQQAERWLRRQAALAPHVTIDARDVLQRAATLELGRSLRPHEERLLSELIQRYWTTAMSSVAHEPEIPSFLRDATAFG